MPINPTDIIELNNRHPARWEGWIPTYTGNGINLLNPSPEEIRIEDIARGVAYKFRYFGQASSITVAEHSLLTATIVNTLWGSSGKVLAALMHDACVAYTPNVQNPVNKFVKVTLPHGEIAPWATLEAKLNQAVAKRFKLESRFWGTPEIKAANILAVAIEKEQCPVLKRTGNWGLPTIPTELADLKLEFLSPDEAEVKFLEWFHELYKED